MVPVMLDEPCGNELLVGMKSPSISQTAGEWLFRDSASAKLTVLRRTFMSKDSASTIGFPATVRVCQELGLASFRCSFAPFGICGQIPPQGQILQD